MPRSRVVNPTANPLLQPKLLRITYLRMFLKVVPMVFKRIPKMMRADGFFQVGAYTYTCVSRRDYTFWIPGTRITESCGLDRNKGNACGNEGTKADAASEPCVCRTETKKGRPA